ncbi:MAG TPA: nucleotide exchange factor GrpE, partial [Geminicoccaceae bacterium]|nr:nucleotide exchange factor GrpE [Geminicoccaceae bacterium]
VEAMNQDKRNDDFEVEPMATAVEQDGAPGEAAAEQPDAGAPEAEAPDDRPAREVELEAELAATKERLLRALADTENLRRRSARELEEAHKYAITGFARELLEVADNLSRALDSIPPRAREEIDFVRNLADGVAITEKALLASFERHQIAKVEPELGSRFDHNRHQAMLEIETGDYPPGTIAQVMQPGYVIADRLLRPALVGVAKARARVAPDESAEDNHSRGVGQPGDRLDTIA